MVKRFAFHQALAVHLLRPHLPFDPQDSSSLPPVPYCCPISTGPLRPLLPDCRSSSPFSSSDSEQSDNGISKFRSANGATASRTKKACRFPAAPIGCSVASPLAFKPVVTSTSQLPRWNLRFAASRRQWRRRDAMRRPSPVTFPRSNALTLPRSLSLPSRPVGTRRRCEQSERRRERRWGEASLAERWTYGARLA
jgi:hypothetical protein